ncbi:MAG: hypothetical protein A3I07_02035 [Candidatus Doudnabacteria bacterium RIFCSPLOWO2_02_FULL_42_9]|uniref:SCP domain-containing protein n=1 Tax=Candidatus Doudnabacteria bacterium RIFCSPHIGHO2_01_FULL_41_86 TaxID=1817821 RepID=A0A1F5N7S9_9BACT|nr:MAG: hypothetical protein A2717_03685 [Candidatus Doudnabacteria bacterium RIFCSPHIGHO2_01_FULL_41_86]OGE74775.1 MAG: hypothetical protein A3K07_03275 [Candidatus Doudnabacteria bacterium RIFCSPHIGHO2_01_43_10]OGE85743.1 MAG: hypothetical protein A3E28_03015 [Candidatus Doudnabacteria bacterium RIFCSPHIGHO2_12_FULL_42_22]OGE87238.1 MAG: hypothetical protein A3C49_00640 [Candidatus Doudnabacteria bacterium RIFCSPHIGHO2_02_FULL_42_25]OGE92075.1 MAG: hypothetical protein A2895_00515 [Candidatus
MNSKLKFGFLLGFLTLTMSLSMKSEPLTSRAILDLVNADRSLHGLSKLTLNPTLNLAALAKAEDMSSDNYFAHTSPDGETPWHWITSMGYDYTYAGENLAEGYSDPLELEKSWMESEPHRANILSPYYSDVGLAIVTRNNTNLVVQLFGSRDQKLTLSQ